LWWEDEELANIDASRNRVSSVALKATAVTTGITKNIAQLRKIEGRRSRRQGCGWTWKGTELIFHARASRGLSQAHKTRSGSTQMLTVTLCSQLDRKAANPPRIVSLESRALRGQSTWGFRFLDGVDFFLALVYFAFTSGKVEPRCWVPASPGQPLVAPWPGGRIPLRPNDA
jgi:hypothetical protein